MSKLGNHDSFYTFKDENGTTVMVEVEHSSEFYRAANKLTDTVREIPLTRSQRQELLKEILALVETCESDSILQTLLKYHIMGE